VITCGMINGGSGFNIIADKVEIIGTTRSFTQHTQELIKTRMQCICCGVGATYGGEIDLEYNCKSCCAIRSVFVLFVVCIYLTRWQIRYSASVPCPSPRGALF